MVEGEREERGGFKALDLVEVCNLPKDHYLRETVPSSTLTMIKDGIFCTKR